MNIDRSASSVCLIRKLVPQNMIDAFCVVIRIRLYVSRSPTRLKWCCFCPKTPHFRFLWNSERSSEISQLQNPSVMKFATFKGNVARKPDLTESIERKLDTKGAGTLPVRRPTSSRSGIALISTVRL